MIKIFHEVPVSMLNASRVFNDGDYALVHVFEHNSDYFNFYKQSVELGRHVILDNSVFELGESFDADKYAEWIKKLQPTEYIIPDVLEESYKTIISASNWVEKYSDLPGRKIGVVQGKTYEDIIACYEFMDRTAKVDKIAFSFDYSMYQNITSHPNKWMSFALGRPILLSRLLEDGVINTNKPHHLLGCALPIEFMFYQRGPMTNNNFKWIDSLDTSNPIVHGIGNIAYEPYGLTHKMSVKMADLLSYVPDERMLKTIFDNINIFRMFVRGRT